MTGELIWFQIIIIMRIHSIANNVILLNMKEMMCVCEERSREGRGWSYHVGGVWKLAGSPRVHMQQYDNVHLGGVLSPCWLLLLLLLSLLLLLLLLLFIVGEGTCGGCWWIWAGGWGGGGGGCCMDDGGGNCEGGGEGLVLSSDCFGRKNTYPTSSFCCLVLLLSLKYEYSSSLLSDVRAVTAILESMPPRCWAMVVWWVLQWWWKS